MESVQIMWEYYIIEELHLFAFKMIKGVKL